MWNTAAASVTSLGDAMESTSRALRQLGPVFDSLADRTPGAASNSNLAREAFDGTSFFNIVANICDNFVGSMRLALGFCEQAAELVKKSPKSAASTTAELVACSLIIEQLACYHAESSSMFAPQIAKFKRYKLIVATGESATSTPRAASQPPPASTLTATVPLVASPVVPAAQVDNSVTPAKPSAPDVRPVDTAPSVSTAAPTSRAKIAPGRRRKAGGGEADAQSRTVQIDTQPYLSLPLKSLSNAFVAAQRDLLSDLSTLLSGNVLFEGSAAKEGSGPASTLRAWVIDPGALSNALIRDMALEGDGSTWETDIATGAACRLHPFGDTDAWAEHLCFVMVEKRRTAVYHHHVNIDDTVFEVALTLTETTRPDVLSVSVASNDDVSNNESIQFFVDSLVRNVEERCKPAVEPVPSVPANQREMPQVSPATTVPAVTTLPAATVPAVAIVPKREDSRVTPLQEPPPLVSDWRPSSLVIPKESMESVSSPVVAKVDTSRGSLLTKIVSAPMSLVSKSQQHALFESSFPELSDDIADTWNCAWRDGTGFLKQGILFLTPRYVCFASPILNAKFSIELRDIDEVSKDKTIGMFDNAVVIRTVLGDEYTLTSFLKRDAAYEKVREFFLRS